MATSQTTLTSTGGWTLISDSGANLILEAGSSVPVFITVSGSAPTVDAPYHRLTGHERLSLGNVNGSVYARIEGTGTGENTVPWDGIVVRTEEAPPA